MATGRERSLGFAGSIRKVSPVVADSTVVVESFGVSSSRVLSLSNNGARRTRPQEWSVVVKSGANSGFPAAPEFGRGSLNQGSFLVPRFHFGFPEESHVLDLRGERRSSRGVRGDVLGRGAVASASDGADSSMGEGGEVKP